MKATYVRHSAIVVGTTNCGGLAKLSIWGKNLCHGVTNVGLQAIPQEVLSEIAHGFHLSKTLDLFQWPINRGMFLILSCLCIKLESLS
ncbi:hypothetical protein R3W88_019406 [Solanum pinnatisectum]|uniref:Uncharacterized protein n=1 Tax=Solanum pinnatisectum TaxID=50273 RepID=A0AAV9KJK1_9SOLN|nr:hypothetical protein R3W88_019406 [Solanum pinnatisectum]